MNNFTTPINFNELSKPVHVRNNVQIYDKPSLQNTCQEVYKHLQNCPVCKKCYENYNFFYIMIIVILASILCIFLFKNYHKNNV